MKTPTPRTDAAEFEVFDGQNLAAVVESEFARKLERELVRKPTPEAAAYLSDDVTVGELIRWLNQLCADYARAGKRDESHGVATAVDQVELALSMFRLHQTLNPPTS